MSRHFPTGTPVDKLPAPAAEPYAIDARPSPGQRFGGKSDRLKATLLKLRPGSDDCFVPDCADTLVYEIARKIGVVVASKLDPKGERRFWRVR